MPQVNAATDRDAALVHRAQRGDGTALGELVTQYQDRVYNVCYRMCHNHADALDLTQTTFLRAVRSIGRFEARSSFYTWLFRIAVNVVRSHRRRGRARRLTVIEDDGDGLPRSEFADADDDGRASTALDAADARERLERALAELDEEFRVAVVLRDIEDMDYARIAEVVRVPVGTVKSRIHRGRMMLRQILESQAE